MHLPKELTTVTQFSKFVALVVFTTLPVISFVYGMQYQQKLDSNTSKVQYIYKTISLTSPTPQKSRWSVYEFLPTPNPLVLYESFSGFRLYYPSDWFLKGGPIQSEGVRLELEFTKNDGSHFSISQGMGDAGRCVYPQDSDYENIQGMASPYDTYVQINKSDSVKWRLSHYKYPQDQWTHSVCNEIKSTTYVNFGAPVGFDKIFLTSPESIKEFEEILRKVEIRN